MPISTSLCAHDCTITQKDERRRKNVTRRSKSCGDICALWLNMWPSCESVLSNVTKEEKKRHILTQRRSPLRSCRFRFAVWSCDVVLYTLPELEIRSVSQKSSALKKTQLCGSTTHRETKPSTSSYKPSDGFFVAGGSLSPGAQPSLNIEKAKCLILGTVGDFPLIPEKWLVGLQRRRLHPATPPGLPMGAAEATGHQTEQHGPNSVR